MKWLKPVADEIVTRAELREGDHVLDVATGSGEPGLTAARRVGSGSVVGLDISKNMISTANAKALSLGIKNYEARLYATSDFPFATDSFDSVVSRFGVMFFPDVVLGLREMARVVKPGRRISLAVWAPQNPRLKSAMQVLNRSIGFPDPPPGAPGPFRCSTEGSIESLMREAGLKDVTRADVLLTRAYPSTESYWEHLLDMNPKIAEGLEMLSQDQRASTRSSVEDALGAESNDSPLEFESTAWVCCGVK